MPRSASFGKALATFLITAIVVVLGFAAVELFRFSFRGFRPGSKTSALVSIEKGSRPAEVATRLEQLGIISSARKLYWSGKVFRKWSKLKAGEYELSPSQSPIEIFAVLNSGISAARIVTIPEGDNMYQIAAALEAKGLGSIEEFLRLFKDQTLMSELGFVAPFPPSLEGYLFPETYYFSRRQTPRETVRQMVQKSLQVYNEFPAARAAELGLSRHQVFTLASVIEKETGASFERPLISSVFHNRLAKRMRLQSDPTTIYGMWTRYRGNISKKDLLEKTPYNTYAIPALPIGPIANPGREALKAALYPGQSDYLFFVSRNDGTHVFTSTFKDHSAAVARFQLDRAAREGKSWRDLNKPAASPTPRN